MKVIIAGGRQYQLTEEDWVYLGTLPITEVVSGCARGADKGGEEWALYNDLPVKRFPADWNSYGKGAGFIRNRAMAKYANAVVLFPGGRGTANMFKEAEKVGIKIYDRREVIPESDILFQKFWPRKRLKK